MPSSASRTGFATCGSLPVGDVWWRAALWLGLLLFVATGCVRRTVTIHTAPEGALVYLNDEEVGRSPATTDFLWYGDYDIIIRREGYQTLRTHEKLKAPWYQVPPIDFFAEVLYPGKIHDQRSMAFTLESEQPPARSELLERAEQLRSEASTDGQR